MLDPGTVRGIGEYGDRHDIDRCRLSRIDHRHRAGFAPPGDHRCDIEPAHLNVRRWQHTEHVDPAAVDAGLLRSLTERGVGQIMIIRVSGTARKAICPGWVRMPAARSTNMISGPAGHLRSRSTPLPAGPRFLAGWRPPGRAWTAAKSIGQVVKPLRPLALRIGHGVTPRYFCAKSRISLAELNGPA